MSEFLGAVFMISIFFMAGITACYIENRKKEKRRKEEELLELQARYVIWSKEQALCEATEQMAEERKRCTPSFRY